MAAKYEYVALTDADSCPHRDNLLKMIGFFQEDEKVGAVTSAVLAKKPYTFMQKLQAIEYKIISFNRKLLDCIDSVYVTPGPFTLYKKKILIEVGMFDTKNMTQDIEIVWRMLYHGYKARMSLSTATWSVTPQKFRAWWRQRMRWNLGGLQTMLKYKKFFFRKGILGAFILPFFVISMLTGIVGIGLFAYLTFKRLWVSYFATQLSFIAGTEILRFSELNLSPSVLNFFGLSLIVFGGMFTFFGLSIVKEKELRDKNLLVLGFYFIFYLALYPILLITSIYKLIRGNYTW
jgi:cellulose synthase/poly-beta-1,6-N-acetylglucosamine synthase-like glycosyltransferase